ncbi:MAG: amidohydrolase [Lachnospiraceae bacterium]|nr:amidohydrolase [Lachnospiraceae bacterium]
MEKGKYSVIDVHLHFAIPEFFAYLEKNNALFEDSILLPRKTNDEMLDMMDQSGTSLAVLTLSSPHPWYKEYPEEGVELCRKLNEAAAELQRRYPDRFRFHATLPLPDVDAAMREAEYALDKLGAAGIKLATNARGQYLGDPALDPLFKMLDERRAIINIHPHRPDNLRDDLFSAKIIPVFEFFADTTRAVLNMMGHGIMERFHQLKIIVPHSGAFLANIADRGEEFVPLLKRLGVLDEELYMKENLSRFYYDMAGNPIPDLMPLLMRFIPASHIMYGSDYPFTPTQKCIDRVADIRAFLDADPKLAPYREMFFHENAERLYRL